MAAVLRKIDFIVRRYEVDGSGIRVDLMWSNTFWGKHWVEVKFAGCGPQVTA